MAMSIALAAVVLTGCTAGESKDSLNYEDSPMSKFFGSDDAAQIDSESANNEALADSKKIEELVAECMQKEGFEYTPQKIDESMFSSGEEWKTEDREWVAQYGYGMMNYPGRDDEAQSVEDPNQDYVAGLSESEANAYYEALNGPMQTEEPAEGEIQEYDWKTAGCYGAASNEVYPEDGTADTGDDSQFEDLFAAMNEMYSAQYESDTPTEADKKWAACMAEKNYPDFARQADATAYISDKLNVLWGNDETGDGSEIPEPSDAPTTDTGGDGTEEDKTQTPEGKALAEEEITVALADLDCREKTDYNDEQLRVQFAAEEKFIEEHRAELDAYKAFMEENEKK